MTREEAVPARRSDEDALPRVCSESHGLCLAARDYVIEHGDALADRALMELLLDTADVLELASNLFARSSELRPLVSSLVVAACERCAAACEPLSSHPPIRDCARGCGQCAERCRRLIAADQPA